MSVAPIVKSYTAVGLGHMKLRHLDSYATLFHWHTRPPSYSYNFSDAYKMYKNKAYFINVNALRDSKG